MATTPYFLWPPHSSTGAPDSDTAGFRSGAPETMSLAPATTTTTAADAALVSPESGSATAAVARPRMRRNSSGSGSGKQQQHQAGGAAKKPPQRGLGVAELERLRCGGDPLRELGLGLGVVGGDAGGQVHPLLHCNPHHHVPAPAFDAASARFCSSLLVQQPPPAPPRPAGPGCYVHHPAAAGGQQRAPPQPLAPEQQYFMDRWGRMGGFTPSGNGAVGDHQTAQLLPLLAAPEHPSSQSTIWRPAPSTCLQSGHRCDLCSRRMTRALAAERESQPPATPPSPTANGTPTTSMPDYSIYDLAAAMATARQAQGGGEAFLARDRKRGAVTGEEAAKKEVREIEFFPAASTHHGGGVTGPDESEFVAPMTPSFYGAGSRAAAPLDLSLRL